MNSNQLLKIFESKFGPGYLASSIKLEFEFRCPHCNGHRRLHACLTKTGVFVCVTPGCNFRGNVTSLGNYDLSDVEEYSFPEKDVDRLSIVYSHLLELARLRDFHREFLAGRGIVASSDKSYSMDAMCVVSSDNVLAKLRTKYSNSELEYCGLVKQNEDGYRATGVIGGNRIIIPYFDPYTSKCIYVRSRVATVDDDTPYLAPLSVPARNVCWGWETHSGSDYVVITEGEFKAQAAKQAGIDAVALPGISAVPTYLAKTFRAKGIKRIFLIFDTDNTIMDTGVSKKVNVDNAMKGIVNKLLGEGYSYNNVTIATLPLLGHNKMDLDKYLMLKTKDDLITVVKEGKKAGEYFSTL